MELGHGDTTRFIQKDNIFSQKDIDSMPKIVCTCIRLFSPILELKGAFYER